MGAGTRALLWAGLVTGLVCARAWGDGMALMNVADAGGAFTEFARLLGASGRLVFSIPHPCYPRRAGSGGVMRIGEDGDQWLDYYRVNDYQREGGEAVPLPDEHDSLHPVATFHRTLTTYHRLLGEAGLVIDGFVEPIPPDRPQARPELGEAWWDAVGRIPYYLVARARKA
jgi:hypothetical protein